jgi:hypothetical protein
MEKSTTQSPTGFSSRTVIISNIYYLSKSVSDKCSPILFADDRNVITANPDETELSSILMRHLLKQINGSISIY